MTLSLPTATLQHAYRIQPGRRLAALLLAQLVPWE